MKSKLQTQLNFCAQNKSHLSDSMSKGSLDFMVDVFIFNAHEHFEEIQAAKNTGLQRGPTTQRVRAQQHTKKLIRQNTNSQENPRAMKYLLERMSRASIISEHTYASLQPTLGHPPPTESFSQHSYRTASAFSPSLVPASPTLRHALACVRQQLSRSLELK